MTTITIDGFNLNAAQVISVARATYGTSGTYAKVALADSSCAALKQSRDFIEATWMQ